jgi:hypothetical protein
MPAKEDVEPRLDRKTEFTETCWLWLGTTTKSGHGLIKCDGKLVGTHVVAYWLDIGLWPGEDEVVRHTCDVPNCVNPDHLLLGTKGDNNRDTIARHPGVAYMKLTQLQVDEIRELARSYSQPALAEMYQVNKSTISRIIHYKRRSVRSQY